MFRKILKYTLEGNVVSLEEIAKFLNKNLSIISDSINLLAIKGYLKNLNCVEIDQDLKYKCFICSQKAHCGSNLLNRYKITHKGIRYLKKGVE